MKVSWMFTDSMMFEVTGGSSKGVAGPARLGLKGERFLRVPGWYSQVGAAEEGGWSGSPKAHSARWLVASALWAAGGVQG